MTRTSHPIERDRCFQLCQLGRPAIRERTRVIRALILVALSAFPLTAQTFGPEIPVSAPAYGLVTTARAVANASNGSGFLVVWSSEGSVFSSRVTLNGDLLEPAGVPLTRGGSSPVLAASAGGDYLVVTTGGSRIVRADGTVEASFELDFGCEGTPSLLLSTGTHYLAARNGCAGILDDEARFVRAVTSASAWESNLTGAADPGGFVVGSLQSGTDNLPHPLVTRIDLEGREIFRTSFPEIVTTGLDVGTNGEESLVAWTDPFGFHAARLDKDGRILDADILLSVLPGSAKITTRGKDFLLIARHGVDLRAAVLRDGVLVSDHVINRAVMSDLSVASAGSTHLISTIEEVEPIDSRGASFYGSISRLFNPDTMEIERVLPTGFAAASQAAPAAASDGQNLLIAWEEFDREKGLTSVLVNLVGPSGPLFPDGLELYDFPTPQSVPAVGFDGVNYLVVWEDYQRIFGQFVSRNRELVGDRFLIAEGGKRPRLSFSGTEYLVAWRKPFFPSEIRATRVTPAGVMLDAPPITIAQAFGDDLQVGWNGDRFILIWVDALDCFRCTLLQVSGATYDPDTEEVTYFEPPLYGPAPVFWDINPVLTCTNTGCVVVFDDSLPFHLDPGIRIVRLPRTVSSGGRARPVSRLSIRMTERLLDGGGRPFVVEGEGEGFDVFVLRAESTILVELDDSGRTVAQREIPEAPVNFLREPFSSLLRVGSRLVWMYARATHDTTYGGAQRVFVRFGN